MSGQKQHNFKIVTTGPESSGKTALAGALAQVLGTVWAPEFARYYVAHLGRPYIRQDLQAIGRGQQAWESWHANRADQILVCDTDWTVLQIWEHYRFDVPAKGHWEWEKGYIKPRPADLYLLCAPDFPWQPDSLREHPEERHILFRWYERLLQEQETNYIVVHGNPKQRLEQAVRQCRELFRPL